VPETPLRIHHARLRRTGSHAVGLLLLLLAIVLTLLWTPARAAAADAEPGALTAAQERGKQIYLSGESPSGGEVTALMGDARIEVPAVALPCASCHGRDGRGRPEGGVTPSDLTWGALTRPYTVTTQSGRERGPYTERLVERAIVLGLDSSGNELDSVMPHYRLSREDSNDLVAYLRKLGQDQDPGVGDDELTIGVLLPPGDATALAATTSAVRRVVDAYATRINGAGGVYARSLRVRYLPLPAAPDERAAAVASFLDSEDVFALTASFIAGADEALADLAEERGIPLVGPLTLHPDESFPLNRQVFYLDAGLPGRARVLVQAAIQRRLADVAIQRRLADAAIQRLEQAKPTGEDTGSGTDQVAAVVYPEDERMVAVADVAAEKAAEGFARVERLAYPRGAFDAAEAVARLRSAGAEDVFLITPGPVEPALLDAAADAGWNPRLHALGTLVEGDLFTPRPGFEGRLYLAFSSLPVDRTPPGLSHFHEALGTDTIELGGSEISAFTAIDLLVDGLERTGRDVTREGLIEALEVLRDHPTGLTPALSFGPNRRVGVRGAYVVTLDPVHPEAPTEVVWVEP